MNTAPQYAYPDHIKQDILQRISSAPTGLEQSQREALLVEIRQLTAHLLTRRQEANEQEPSRKPVDLLQDVIEIENALIQANLGETICEIPGWDLRFSRRPEPEADQPTIVSTAKPE